MTRQKKHTLDELLTLSCAHAGVSAGDVVPVSRDDVRGSATFRVPPLAVRREMVLQVSPAHAYIKEHVVDVRLALSAHVGSAGNVETEAIRDALKARFGASSDAEMHRRVYALVGELLGVG